MGDCFKGMGTEKPKKFKFVRITKFAKQSFANQTALLSTSSNPLTRKSSFSGRHKQMFTDKLLEYFESSKTTASDSTKNIETIMNLMQQGKEGLVTD